jgi:hypothetical protein
MNKKNAKKLTLASRVSAASFGEKRDFSALVSLFSAFFRRFSAKKRPFSRFCPRAVFFSLRFRIRRPHFSPFSAQNARFWTRFRRFWTRFWRLFARILRINGSFRREKGNSARKWGNAGDFGASWSPFSGVSADSDLENWCFFFFFFFFFCATVF